MPTTRETNLLVTVNILDDYTEILNCFIAANSY
jgi:hypothetical protein